MLRIQSGNYLHMHNEIGTLFDVVCTILDARGATFVFVPSWKPV